MIDVPATQERVPLHSPAQTTEDIRALSRARIVELAGRLDCIQQRLEELEQEWDVERTLEANAASVALVGGILSLFSRKWAFLPVLVGGFLLQHAVTGWCPPIEFFRRIGVRTAREIEQERFALKAMRGDFEGVRHEGANPCDLAHAAIRAVGLNDSQCK